MPVLTFLCEVKTTIIKHQPSSFFIFLHHVQKQPPKVFCKKMFLKISQNSQENSCRGLFLDKGAGLKPTTFSKETPTPVFSREFCEIFKNTLFTDAMYYCDIYYLQCVPFLATNCHYTSYQNNKSTKI